MICTCAGTYDIGDVVRFSGDFTVSGSYADPTEVTLKIKSPAGVITTYTYGAAEVSKLSTGRYYKDITQTVSGQVWYRYEGTGAVISAGESYIIVNPSEFD